jgi:hypothetical protein
MTMLNDAQWMNRSRPIGKLDVRIGFVLSHTFYIGDPNDSAQLQDPAYRQHACVTRFSARLRARG